MPQTTQTIAEDLRVGLRLLQMDTAGKTQYRIARICTDGLEHPLYQTAEVHEALDEYLRARGVAYQALLRSLMPDDFRTKWPH